MAWNPQVVGEGERDWRCFDTLRRGGGGTARWSLMCMHNAQVGRCRRHMHCSPPPSAATACCHVSLPRGCAAACTIRQHPRLHLSCTSPSQHQRHQASACKSIHACMYFMHEGETAAVHPCLPTAATHFSCVSNTILQGRPHSFPAVLPSPCWPAVRAGL